MRLIYVLCFFAFASCGFFTGKPERATLTEGVHYFSGFSNGKFRILTPVDPISESVAKQSKTYVRVTVDSNGRIIMFEKFLDQKFFFSHKYEYYDGGQLKSVEAVNEEGRITKNEYTVEGDPIR